MEETPSPFLQQQMLAAAEMLRAAKRMVVLTGAGVSAESGIATFRGNGGLWNNLRFQDLASTEGFQRDPALVWQWYLQRRANVAEAQPNPAHHAIAALEQRAIQHGLPFTLITQNVDNLHERAGSKNMLKVHGDLFLTRCWGCTYQRKDRAVSMPEYPAPCPECGAALRPGVVWFGEEMPQVVWQKALRAVHDCDLLLVVGTSAQVYPAASLIALAKAKRIEINPEATDATELVDLALAASATVLAAILQKI